MQFQSYAYAKNHWLLEPDLKPILQKYQGDLSSFEPALTDFGELAGGSAYEVADYVDRTAHPELVSHDLNGCRIDRVRLDPEHARLLKEMAFINRPPYEGGSWLLHYALGFLLADTGLYCSLIVTNQTAYAIHKYAPEQKAWLEPLLSGQAWGATWMTETHAGSDLGANRTRAVFEDGTWRLYGDDKYFASNAGLADLAVVTARPEGAPLGPKGIALFLVPRLDEQGRLNYNLLRLKRKSATRAVPTGEVAFNGSLAYLVGEPQLGIYYTMENLTVSRLANAAGAMGLARKAHLEALFRVQARTSFGKPLMDHPLIRRDLTDLAVRTAGGLALTFYAVQAFDRSWHDMPPYSPTYHYARLLSHLAKNATAEHSAAATQLVMELFGGLGFLEDYAVSRLHRESLVTSIWEGASNIQALELLEAVHKKHAHEILIEEIHSLLAENHSHLSSTILQVVETSLAKLSSTRSEEAQWYAKDALAALAHALQAALLVDLSRHAGERYAHLAELYAARFIDHHPYPAWALEDRQVWDIPVHQTQKEA